MPNAYIETQEKTLDSLVCETLPALPAPFDAPALGNSPLQADQAATLPAESALQLAIGSTTSLGLAVDSSATLPAGAMAEADVEVEVMATIAGTVVTNLGGAAAIVGVTIPGLVLAVYCRLGLPLQLEQVRLVARSVQKLPMAR